MSPIPTQCPPRGITARATIDRVIDGDTIVVELRDTIVTLRLLNCWAPERGTDAGRDATDAMEAFCPPGASCTVHIPTGDADNLASLLTFGRLLAVVWMNGDPDSLNHHMVNLGYATVEKSR